jgi:hypothetical protein
MKQNGSAEDTTMGAAVVVRLPHDLRDALRARAAMEDRTLASLLRVAARAYLDDVARRPS